MVAEEPRPKKTGRATNYIAGNDWRRRTTAMLLAFVFLLAVTAVVEVIAARYSTTLYRHALNYHFFLERELRLTLLAFATADFHGQRLLQTGPKEAEREFQTSLEDFGRHLRRLEELGPDGLFSGALHALEEAVEDYRHAVAKDLLARERGDLLRAETVYQGEVAACRQEVFAAGEQVGEAIEAHLQEANEQLVAGLRWLAVAKGVLGLAFALLFGLCLLSFREFGRLAEELAETAQRFGPPQSGIGGKLGQLVTVLNARLGELQDIATRLTEKTRHLRGAVDTLAEGAEQATRSVMDTTWAAFQAARDAEVLSAGSVTLSDRASMVTGNIGQETAKLAVVLEEVGSIQEGLERACGVLRRLEAAVSEGKELGGFRQEIAGLAALLNPEGGATGEAVRRIREAFASFRDTLGVLEKWGRECKELVQRLLALKEQVVTLGAMAEQHTAMVEEVTSSVYVLAQMAEELEELAARLKVA